MSNTSNAVLAITRWTFLVALFVLANAIGNASPYLYLLALLIALPFLLADPKARAAMNRWESYGYAAAFLCIAIAAYLPLIAGAWLCRAGARTESPV